MNKLITRVGVGVSLGIWMLSIGCETTHSSSATSSDEQIYLKKGMTASDVKTLLGHPVSTSSKVGAEGTLETWVYRETKNITRQVQADTREVPYTNPISRETTTIEEPVTVVKTDRVTLSTELYLLNGQLIGWKETVDESIDFQDR